MRFELPVKVMGHIEDGGGDVVVDFVYQNGGARPVEHHVRHSPAGFQWGYNGSGPAELSRCILIALVGTLYADAFYQDFKDTFVVPMPQGESWELPVAVILVWVADKLRQSKF